MKKSFSMAGLLVTIASKKLANSPLSKKPILICPEPPPPFMPRKVPENLWIALGRVVAQVVAEPEIDPIKLWDRRGGE